MIFCVDPIGKFNFITNTVFLNYVKKMNDRSIIRAAYIQNNKILFMKSINKHKDSTYDYSGLFIDDEEL